MHQFLPLTPSQRVLYAAVMEQTEAIFALEYMAPNQHDEAIKVAVLTGQVAPEDVRDQILAHLLKNRSLYDFKVQALRDIP